MHETKTNLKAIPPRKTPQRVKDAFELLKTDIEKDDVALLAMTWSNRDGMRHYSYPVEESYSELAHLTMVLGMVTRLPGSRITFKGIWMLSIQTTRTDSCQWMTRNWQASSAGS